MPRCFSNQSRIRFIILIKQSWNVFIYVLFHFTCPYGECGGSVVERQTPEPEVKGSKPTSAMLCP